MFRVGNRVWDFKYGWGTVIDIDYSFSFPIAVKFDELYFGKMTYTEEGKNVPESNRTLFFEEFSAPESALSIEPHSWLYLYESCKGVNFVSGERNYYLRMNKYGNIYITSDSDEPSPMKYISFEDAFYIVENCAENIKNL